jgi:hypothetical protein
MMKWKVVVIDFELSPRQKRLLLRVGLPVATLVGATAIAYAAVPNVFVPGQALTAASLNENFARLDSRVTSLETVTPSAAHANVADTATNATHAMTADTATSATHAATADVASALGAGPIGAGLVIYNVPGAAVAAPCSMTSGFVTDCTCPDGMFVLSGGGDSGQATGHILRESRALTSTTWRITCTTTTADVACATYTLVCSRMGP